MAIEGVDYSFARPGGARLRQAGKVFAVRYLYNGSKGLTNAEIADLKNNGIAIAVVYEESAESSKKGFAEGARQARVAQALLNGLNLEKSLPIYCAVDHDVTNDMAAVIDFVRGFASVLGVSRTGVYGEYDVMIAARQANVASFFWQTYAWSRGKLADFVHLYQYSNDEWNGQVDFTRAYQSNYGQSPVGSNSASVQDSDDDEELYGSGTVYFATSTYGYIRSGWRYLADDSGVLRALSAEQTVAYQLAHPKMVDIRYDGRDLYRMAQALGIWEYTGNEYTGPIALTGRLIGRNADINNQYGTDYRGFPPTRIGTWADKV